MWPTLKVLEKLGGSASNSELDEAIADYLDLSDDVMEATK